MKWKTTNNSKMVHCIKMHNSLVNSLVDENVGKNTKTVTSLLLKTVLHPALPTITHLDGNLKERLESSEENITL